MIISSEMTNPIQNNTRSHWKDERETVNPSMIAVIPITIWILPFLSREKNCVIPCNANSTALKMFSFVTSFFGYPFPPECGAGSKYKNWIQVIRHRMSGPHNSHTNRDNKNYCQDRYNETGWMNRDIYPSQLFKPYCFHLEMLLV